MVTIETYSMQEIAPFSPLLEEWMKRDYIHYPYLWVPAKGECSLDLFINEKSALVIIAKREEKIVGLAGGMSFECENLQNFFQAPLTQLAEKQGFKPDQLFYMSFFLTAPECRNEQSLVLAIYDTYVKYAKSLGKTKICYWYDSGTPKHLMKPSELIPIEPWGYVLGDFTTMDIKLDLPWSTLQADGSVKEEMHPAEFFFKDL
jgi:hypothetical protein